MGREDRNLHQSAALTPGEFCLLGVPVFSPPRDAAGLCLALAETVRTFPNLDYQSSRAIKRRPRVRTNPRKRDHPTASAFLIPRTGGICVCGHLPLQTAFLCALPASLRLSPREPRFGLLSYREYLSDANTPNRLFASPPLWAQFYLRITVLSPQLGWQACSPPSSPSERDTRPEMPDDQANGPGCRAGGPPCPHLPRDREMSALRESEDRVTGFASFGDRASAVFIGHVPCVRHQCHLI